MRVPTRIQVARRTRAALGSAPVPNGWARDAARVQVALASRGVSPCTILLGGHQVSSVSAERLAYLHREIFVDLAYYFRASRPDPVIVDGGSNIGVSVVFFKTLYPAARVMAFEPSETAYELLARNAGHLPDVDLQRVALGRGNGMVAFFEEPDDPASLLRSTRSERLPNPVKTTVEQRRLSDFIVEDVDLVKLDIEGAETAVVEELAASGKIDRVGQMIVEYHHRLDPDRDHVDVFLALLRDYGFTYRLSATMRDRGSLTVSAQDVLVHAYRAA